MAERRDPPEARSRPAATATLPEHVTLPLLSVITQRSLDADYEHVAARRRAEGGQVERHPVPRRTAGLVLLVFGLLVTVAAVQTSRNAPASDASRASLIEQINLRRQGVDELQRQIAREEQDQLALQRSVSSLQSQTRAAQSRLAGVQSHTGFGPVTGPGIKITVTSAPGADTNNLVRDSDLALLTDALWGAGAQAISVNGQRLTVLSAFRNVGIGILVNSQPVNPPYVFSVVGNPDTLPANLLSTSAGARWYALKNSLGFRFDVVDGGTMTLPAATQPSLRSARLAPPDRSTTQARRQKDSAS